MRNARASVFIHAFMFTVLVMAAAPAARAQTLTGVCTTSYGLAVFNSRTGLTCGNAFFIDGSLVLGGTGDEMGTNRGLSIQGDLPYWDGYVGLRLENTYIDSVVRQVMVTDKYQWSVRIDTDRTFQIHEDGPVPSLMSSPDTSRLTIVPGTGDVLFGGQSISVGPNPASTGIVRIPNGSVVRGRNATNNGDVDLVSVNAAGNVIVGDAATSNTRIRSALGTPETLQQGDWWVECSGVRPARTCAVKVIDSGLVVTIAVSPSY